MRRLLRILLIVLAVIVAIPVLLVAVVLLLANIGPGRALIESQVASLTGDAVRIAGGGGRFPDALRLAHLELRDKDGTYASVDGLALDWSPLRLIGREALIDRLSATHVDFARLPVASAPASKSSSGFNLPVSVTVRQLAVDRLDLGAPLAGKPVALTVGGSAALASLQQGSADITLHTLAGDAQYVVKGNLSPSRIDAIATVREPAKGLISGLAGLPDLGAIALDATLAGPQDAIGTKLALTAGPLRADANGTVDLTHQAADLTVAAHAPAMTPAPGLSWQSVGLDATVRGPFTKPAATGTLRIAALEAGGASVQSIAADLQGNAGAAQLKATLDGLRIPGPKPDLLAGAPVQITADARLDAPDRPVAFTLAHKLIAARGTAHTGGDLSVDTTLDLPDLAPFAALGGVDLRGRADLAVRAAQHAGATDATIDGTVGVTGGMAPVPGLVGDAAKLSLAATLRGSDLALSHLTVDGKTIALSAKGGKTGDKVDLDWTLGLADLAVLAPTVGGDLKARGHVGGPLDDLAAVADLDGDIAVQKMPRGPLRAHLEAEHLPGAPTGRVTADGTLAGAPLTLAAAAQRGPDGALHLDISKTDWKSAHAEAALVLPPGATLPLGKLDLRMTRLDDLRPVIGQPLTGGVTASLATEERGGKPEARVKLQARDAGLAGTASVARADLDATVLDPAGTPSVANGVLTVDGLAAQGTTGSAKLTVSGPQTALAAKLSATAHNFAGADAVIDTATVLNAKAREANVSSLNATWKGQALRLLAPVRIGFADGVTLDRLRLGLQQATLEVAGRVSPTLDVTVALRNVTPDLAKPFVPQIDADGAIRADAKLTGTPAQPNGTVRLDATGLRMRTGPGRGLPPANLTASADLAGGSARIDTRLAAGRLTTLTVTGTAPIDPARPIDLRAVGNVDLAMLDPILAPDGRRARGQLALDAGVAGTLSAPRLSGTTRLSGGDIQDFAQGVHITDIAAQIALQGDTIRIVTFTGRAGPGTIGVVGTVAALAPSKAVDITVTANNARPLAGERITVTLDANLTLRGTLPAELALGGNIHIRGADITIPERLPPSIAVLHVRRPGDKPPAPPAPGPEIALDLTIEAERAIFVRGRGLFAELGGHLRLRGTSTKPQPLGAFTMRQGTFSIAGTTLTFSKGEVSFNGGSLTDPSLDFVASSTNGSVTANLNVGGTASAPKITLTSTPELPQDEVLAQLLFKRSASSLSPFELASLAAALAELSGVGGGVGNPLESVRKGLGLDQLSVGSGASGSATLQAGRYVAPGVFVGARQGASGTSTQGLVQLDLYKGLKAEGTVGTGSNTNPGATPADSGGSSVGLTYQFEY